MPRTWKKYRKAHNEVLKSPHFYSDEHYLGPGFDLKNCLHRKNDVLACLQKDYRTLKRIGDRQTATKISGLRTRLTSCKAGRRCGSLACAICARAFQCAKAQAHRDLIADLISSEEMRFACVTIIPPKFLLAPSQLSAQSVNEANRWLADRLRTLRITQPIVGSIDLEFTTFGIQLHWHLVIPTKERKALQHILKSAFPASKACRTPVVSKWMKRLAWLNYSHKLIKLPVLLRRHRRLVSNAMVWLDEIEPLASMFLMNGRLGTGRNALTITPRQTARHFVSKSQRKRPIFNSRTCTTTR